ncbi:hypothetical protein BH11MYX3_BH11MYX3_31340 [soil metagenome]
MPLAASGDKYPNLPFTTPGSLDSIALLTVASPKPPTFRSPVVDSRSVRGDMSRWMKPHECA